jgi:pyruvate formate lyase activating enzyme
MGPEVAFYHKHCQACFQCKKFCSKNAIYEDQDRRIDFSRCDNCGECVYACEFGAIRIIGKDWNASALLDEVLRDKDFYEDSGGGITLSGGEPMLHVKFLEFFLPRIKENGIHVNIETSGLFNWEQFERIRKYIDLIYFDLKIVESKKHKELTGVENQRIHRNFSKIAKSFSDLQARMPVVPGINDHEDNIIKTANLLKQNRQSCIHLLPYHNMGEAKLSRINSKLCPLNKKSLSANDLEPVKEAFARENIDAIVYD